MKTLDVGHDLAAIRNPADGLVHIAAAPEGEAA